MTEVIVGLDVGGTKTAALVATRDGIIVSSTEIASDDWDAEPIDQGVEWISRALQTVVPDGCDIVAVGIGAQGLDTPEIAQEFSAALTAKGFAAVCVNDAALLIAAVGLSEGIGLISGTGAIGIGADEAGQPLVSGGWGWVIGDEAGSAGIVREATKAALGAHDSGAPDDGLLAALLSAFGVENAERLARAVNDEPTMDNWGPRAPAIFAAAENGSLRAAAVISAAAEHLAARVDHLVARGATGHTVVAAGGVIVNQPRLFDELRALVTSRHPSLSVVLLTEPPVVGALALARTLITNRTSTKES